VAARGQMNVSSMQAPEVSIVIPTFNRGHLLGQSLSSVFAQDSACYEIIVVDDGSTDGTEQLVRGLDRRLCYVQQANRGPAAARNRGIGLARGRYVAFLDSDDLWFPEFLSSVCRVFGENASADAVIADSEMWQDDELVVPSRFKERGLSLEGITPASALPPFWLRSSLFSTCCLVVRRDTLARWGPEPFDATLRAYEDWDLEIRLYRDCRTLLYPQVLARVRRYPDDTRPLDTTAIAAKYAVMERIPKVHPLDAASLEEWRSLRAEAARSLAKRWRGMDRLRAVSLAMSEWGYGDRRNAMRVLTYSILPEALRDALRRVASRAGFASRRE